MSGRAPAFDARFSALNEALASRGHVSETGTPDGYREAAVALVLRASPSLELLLIKRAQMARDPWSGHMALPGGRRDDSDVDLLSTASRETHEETGLDLGQVGTPLGRLDVVATAHRLLPKLAISPFVFGVPAGVSAAVASAEVERVHWVAVNELRSAARHSTVEIAISGGTSEFPCIRVADDVVWGLTYRIVQQLLELWPER